MLSPIIPIITRLAAVGLLAGSCTQVAATPTSSGDPTPEAAPTPAGSLDLTRLPVGDGLLAPAPKAGYVWPCVGRFPDRQIHGGPWINADGTFDYTQRAIVPGEDHWSGDFRTLLQGSSRTLQGNGLPQHTTGSFPANRNTDAFRYDPNPNRILPQTLNVQLPAVPVIASQASCLPQGPIGVMVSGAALFSSLDAAGLDAVAHEVRDRCDGHPQGLGVYHYHNLSACIDDSGSRHSRLVGYALDGFGIFGPRGENGSQLHNADLDACHGHPHDIGWDDKRVALYHYHATQEYPYTLGCFRGTPTLNMGMERRRPTTPLGRLHPR